MGSIAKKIDHEARELARPFVASRRRGRTRSDEEPPMEAVGGDSVWRLERPVREDRLHDLKAVGDPIDAADECLLIHAGLRRGRKAEHDLWLDTGLGQAIQRHLKRTAGEGADGAVVDTA